MTAQKIVAVRALLRRNRAAERLAVRRAIAAKPALDEALIRLALALLADGIVN